ncbi:carbohydrate ABC transporter permease [Mumia sp. zg.B53]|uniref:carbohydrate ABC transporter permease n=1 Tax=unclassified Mumia TaxID=2621872 RepID=UPI001C6E05DA|nr:MULTISPECIES: carbohydrate ABC transporter permease [unclassified Mumia]MBW9206863.1 carbohydrate ABC transporter permease [Mumia sp. zg.B17]MBW9210850.1 carbohydrate ABC transporter permease [Mumia sp. zg.B21]MBW9215415.1 carbohydrate ABC transporter permease [Mumia sp. zg.B53]MDD9349920.1 carbohydrate ABC transporter permease [Mumia sp.]
MSPRRKSRVVWSLVAIVIGLIFAGAGLVLIDRPDLWLWLIVATVFVLTGAVGLLLGDTAPHVSWSSIVGAELIVLYTLTPVVYLLSLSLKGGNADVNQGGFLPHDPGLDNYETVFKFDLFQSALVNSFGISVISTTISVVLATFAAYAIARLRFRGKKFVLSMALAIAMFPVVALVGPLFDMWRAIGIYDTWLGLIIPYLSFTLPMSIWVLSAFFREIPWEMEQAAQVDGASSWQAFRKVIVPLAAPGVFTAAIITFFFAWNDFVFGISLTSTTRAIPVPASLAFFTGASQFDQPIAAIAAASVVVTVPIFIIVLLFQRKIVSGLTSGAVKG